MSKCFIYFFIYCFIYFLTSTGSSFANSPASDAGFVYPDEAATNKVSLHLYARLIQAINDIVPSTLPVNQRPEPYLYWVDGLDATNTLIKRYVFVIVTCVIFFTVLCKNLIPHDTKNIPLYKCVCAAYLVWSEPIMQYWIQFHLNYILYIQFHLNFILQIYIILSDVTIMYYILLFKVPKSSGSC